MEDDISSDFVYVIEYDDLKFENLFKDKLSPTTLLIFDKILSVEHYFFLTVVINTKFKIEHGIKYFCDNDEWKILVDKNGTNLSNGYKLIQNVIDRFINMVDDSIDILLKLNNEYFKTLHKKKLKFKYRTDCYSFRNKCIDYICHF